MHFILEALQFYRPRYSVRAEQVFGYIFAGFLPEYAFAQFLIATVPIIQLCSVVYIIWLKHNAAHNQNWHDRLLQSKVLSVSIEIENYRGSTDIHTYVRVCTYKTYISNLRTRWIFNYHHRRSLNYEMCYVWAYMICMISIYIMSNANWMKVFPSDVCLCVCVSL